MGLNQTPSSERVHIAFFGRRNAGKSSLINAVTGQDLAIVSEIQGTTTDPVYKAMELLPMGPVMLVDTPGIDDDSELSALRVKKSYQVLNKTDVAILVVDGAIGKTGEDERLIKRFREKNIPYIVAFNKADLQNHVPENLGEIWVSARDGLRIHELKEMIAKQSVTEDDGRRIVGDIIEPSDFVVLVVPIDKSAPKGRLILPQQQTIRDILESDAAAIVVKEYELKEALANLGKKPKLVITDSQVFDKVSADTPKNIMLTSFSILFARYKGDLEYTVKSVKAIDELSDGDRVLIGEGCTHHRQCDDIGTVKIPGWITRHTGARLEFDSVSGTEFPDDLSPYKIIVHCGGCMLNEREMKYRLSCARDQNIPMTNFGVLIAYMQGILKRSVEPFPHIARALEGD